MPAYSGEMTILPGHSPMITTLGTGILKYKVKGIDKTHKAVISWGYCEVTPEAVNVLAEFMQTPDEVVVSDSQATLVSTEKKLGSEFLTDQEFKLTVQEAAKARSAIEIVKH